MHRIRVLLALLAALLAGGASWKEAPEGFDPLTVLDPLTWGGTLKANSTVRGELPVGLTLPADDVGLEVALWQSVDWEEANGSRGARMWLWANASVNGIPAVSQPTTLEGGDGFGMGVALPIESPGWSRPTDGTHRLEVDVEFILESPPDATGTVRMKYGPTLTRLDLDKDGNGFPDDDDPYRGMRRSTAVSLVVAGSAATGWILGGALVGAVREQLRREQPPPP